MLHSATAAVEHLVERDKDGWKFLHAYPRHLLARRVDTAGGINIDGKLDETSWAGADWHKHQYVDITQHKNNSLNYVPAFQQADVATLWDDEFLYIGARLNDPIVFATVPAEHNGRSVPYVDNDFEVFLDVSSTNQFYKEFEMNVLNATYDVNWGVPDDFSLNCDASGNHSKHYLPVCVNTSSHFYAGNWTMHGGISGLKTATHTYSEFGSDVPNATGFWTVELAFPIRNGTGSDGIEHGGLLDTDGGGSFDFSEYDPLLGPVLPGLPRFWSADISRVGHPRKFFIGNNDSDGFVWCPFFNCSDDIIKKSKRATLNNPGANDCAILAANDKTILGSDPHYGCYWEWVLQNVGSTNAYMHRPMRFAYIQFMMQDRYDNVKSYRQDVCGNIDFPTRHLLLTVFEAQRNYKAHTGSFATKVSDLLKNNSIFCREPLCAATDLKYALTRPDIFQFQDIHAVKNATSLNEECSARPCFLARLTMIVPAGSGNDGPTTSKFVVEASITQNQRFEVEHQFEGELVDAVAPCLFSKHEH